MAGVHIVGVEKVSTALKIIGTLSVVATGEAMRQVLNRVARQERTLLSMGWHPPGTPTGSIPPEPPWRISGHLSRKVEVRGPFLRGLLWPRWEGKVGNDAVYARIHEFGGWTGRGYRSYLPPRPHLAPAWRIVRPTMKATFEHELRKALRLK